MQHEELVQTKTLLLQCYLAEMNLANFLLECTERHASGLSFDETLKAKELSEKVYAYIQKLKSDEKKQSDDSDDKVPLPIVTKFICGCY